MTACRKQRRDAANHGHARQCQHPAAADANADTLAERRRCIEQQRHADVRRHATGDSGTVTVMIYSGSSASGTPVETLTATPNATSGAYSVSASPALATGTYTARPAR